MVIDKASEACGYYVEKDFSTFCSAGCLLQSFEDRRKHEQPPPDRIYFADYLGTGLQPSDSVTFLVTGHIRTVMEWGVISFADPGAARGHRQHDDEVIVDWVGLRTVRGRPDRNLALVFTPDGAVPEVVELKKGELIEWELVGSHLDDDLVVQLRGYEEMGEIVIPSSGDTVRVRMLALKPGAGFPFVRSGSGEVFGRVRVIGPHTPGEEKM